LFAGCSSEIGVCFSDEGFDSQKSNRKSANSDEFIDHVSLLSSGPKEKHENIFSSDAAISS
jgi:hypothetical protein